MFKEAKEQVRNMTKSAGVEQYLPYLGLAAMLGSAYGGYHLLKPDPSIWSKVKRYGLRAYREGLPAIQQMGQTLQQQAALQQQMNQMQMNPQMMGMGIMPQMPQQNFIPPMAPLGGPVSPVDDTPSIPRDNPPHVNPDQMGNMGISPQDLVNFKPNPSDSVNSFLA